VIHTAGAKVYAIFVMTRDLSHWNPKKLDYQNLGKNFPVFSRYAANFGYFSAVTPSLKFALPLNKTTNSAAPNQAGVSHKPVAVAAKAANTIQMACSQA
jgi:hypothetical protein